MGSSFLSSDNRLSGFLASVYISLKDLDGRLSFTRYSDDVVDDCLVYEARLHAIAYLFFEEPCVYQLITAISSIRLSLISKKNISIPQKLNYSYSLSLYYRMLYRICPSFAEKLSSFSSHSSLKNS